MKKHIALHGVTDKLVKNVIDRWLIGIRETNPAILDMFKERNIRPYRDLLPWSGEFAGKYLTSAYYAYAMTGDVRLRGYVENFIDELLRYQADDGYLGCFSDACKLTGAFSRSPEKTGETWDSWAHYHLMVGLMLWYGETGDARCLACTERIAGLYLRLFYHGKKLSEIGSTEMNLAVYHAFAMLYRLVEKPEYLAFAREIEADLRSAGAEDYLAVGLSGREFYTCRKPRWESLHVIMGFAEMYRATGDERYKRAFLSLTDSILRTDVHNTGGFSTNEQAVGDPFADGPIETCCVVAFNATVRLAWELTHDVKYIEHLELAHYNAMLGAFSRSGLWSTYDTPMDGVKKANFQDIGFQCRPGSPMLNCCSVNAPRGLAEIGTWAIAEDELLYINSFEDADYLSGDTEVHLRGGYPYRGEIEIGITNPQKRVAIRIPAWSRHTKLLIGGKTFAPAAGTYFTVEGSAKLLLKLDLSARVIRGAKEKAGKFSVYCGCLLLALDAARSPQTDLHAFAASEIEALGLRPVPQEEGIAATLGGSVLVDFYSAGQSGSRYLTWFPAL